MDIGLVSAFIGGILALLSPCAALLMPAFFASRVGAGPRLLVHGVVFYAGLLLVLLPLGVAAGTLGAVFATHRQAIVLASSALLVVLGAVQVLGFGFDTAQLLPGASGVQARANRATGWLKTLLLGAASGIAGFCAGPILGAVLTLAAARGDVFSAGGMLAVYGAGMIAPLLLIAALWNRLGSRGQRMLRGRSFSVLGRELHTTTVLTGLLVIAVGVLFWTTNGLVGAPQLLPVDAQAWLQERSALLANPVLDIVAILVVATAIFGIWLLRRRRAQASSAAGNRR